MLPTQRAAAGHAGNAVPGADGNAAPRVGSKPAECPTRDNPPRDNPPRDNPPRDNTAQVSAEVDGGGASPPRRLRRSLDILDRDHLVELLIGVANRQPELARQLSPESAQVNDDLLGIAATLDAALRVDEPLSPGGALRYADAATGIAATLAALVGSGRAGAALPLLSHAVDLLCAAMRHDGGTARGTAHDTAGDTARDIARDTASDTARVLPDLLVHLLRLHAAAAAAVDPRPDPATLGGWLAELRLYGPAGVRVPLDDYAPTLGAAGLDAYREVICRAWRCSPGDMRVRAAREELARHGGDIPAPVEVVGGGLRRAVHYSRLARALRDLGARSEALAWAQRGLHTDPHADPHADPHTPPETAPQDLVTSGYRPEPPVDDVLPRRRAALEGVPSLSSYLALRGAARQAGRWAQERPTALALLRRRRPDEYIRALLADDDTETAWQQASTLPLHPRVWDELARRRADARPADAIPVLRRRIDEVLSTPSRDNYRDAVRRLIRLREACRRSDQAEVFARYVRRLLDEHRRRPAFLRELTQAGLADVVP